MGEAKTGGDVESRRGREGGGRDKVEGAKGRGGNMRLDAEEEKEVEGIKLERPDVV